MVELYYAMQIHIMIRNPIHGRIPNERVLGNLSRWKVKWATELSTRRAL